MDITRISTLNELQKLLELLGLFEVGEFEIESENRKLRISKMPSLPAGAGLPLFAGTAAIAHPQGSGSGPAAGEAAGAEAARVPEGVQVVTSPMVGTFYRAPSPEADPFVQEGDRVEADGVVCIIEAMKVMNEIPSGHAGIVQKILVQNGDSVQFGQPIFHILTE